MNNRAHLPTAVVLLICATVAVAQTTTTNTVLKGKLVTAGTAVTGLNYSANLNISPYTSAQGVEGYMVNWSTAVYGGPMPPPTCVLPGELPPPLPPLTMATNVNGIVPVNSIKVSPTGALSIDLDVPQLQTVFSAFRIDCTAGPCVTSYPVSFPVKGEFTPKTAGPGAWTFTNNGNRDSVNIDSVCTTTSSFTGTDSGGAANFVGTIGAIAVSAPSLGSNGSMHMQKGQLRATSVCAPPPPPPASPI